VRLERLETSLQSQEKNTRDKYVVFNSFGEQVVLLSEGSSHEVAKGIGHPLVSAGFFSWHHFLLTSNSVSSSDSATGYLRAALLTRYSQSGIHEFSGYCLNMEFSLVGGKKKRRGKTASPSHTWNESHLRSE
jgi:hypothetical protein